MIADIENDPGHEGLLATIARQAARAPRQQLTLLLGLATLGSVAAAVAAVHSLALGVTGSALCAATAVLALRELCGRSHVGSPRLRAVVQRMLAALGVLLWFLGGMALLLALLGNPWQL